MKLQTLITAGLALALVLALAPVATAYWEEFYKDKYPMLVHGHVYDEKGEPMSSVYVGVTITNQYGVTGRWGTWSLDDGYYHFPSIPLADPTQPVLIEFIAPSPSPPPTTWPYPNPPPEYPPIYGSGYFIPAEGPVKINAYAEGSVFRLEFIYPTPEPEPIIVEVDIDPDTLKLKSKGKWITAYIELPDDYKAADVDISTIRLNGMVPAEFKPVEIDDEELMVKFDCSAVQAIVQPGEEVMLTITGMVGGCRSREATGSGLSIRNRGIYLLLFEF